MSDATATQDSGVLELQRERQAFIDRVRENERLAAADPEGYRRKLRTLVWMGYAYIGAMLLLVLLLSAALVAFVVFGHRIGGFVIKIGFLLAALLFGIVRSLWVKIDRPEGLLVPRERAPELWNEVEAIADRLGAPRPDEIRLDEEFNAAAIQWPRYGILGGYRSTLTLGLPLLASLSHEEARGVIAHEFGHFSGKHGRFAVWIYRVNATWSQLGENLSQNGSSLFRPFVNWFNPRFAATSFALRRQHEYEADRAAAEIVGAPVVAGTLARLDALGDHQQRVLWDPLEREAARVGTPTAGFFSRMAETIRQPFDHDAANRRLAFALAQPTDYDDSHPSLTDRLAALGQPAPGQIAPPPLESAAEAFFGKALPAIVSDLERYYMAKMAPAWSVLTQRKAQYAQKLEALERATADRPPTEEEAVEMTFLRARSAEPAEAIQAFRALRASLPENATAAFLLGQALIQEDDAEGVALLRFAAERDSEFADSARALLGNYHARQGDHGAFAALRDEAQEAHDRQRIAEAGSKPRLRDDLLPPDLSEEEKARIGQSLKKVKGLARAYAFRKRLPGTGEIRHYLFLVAKAASFVGDDPVVHFLKQFDEHTDLTRPFTIMAEKDPKAWQKRLEDVPDTRVYDYKAK